MADNPADAQKTPRNPQGKKPEHTTECTVELAKAVYEGLLKRDGKASSRKIAAVIEEELGIRANFRTIARWKKAGWPKNEYDRTSPIHRIASALEEAVAKTNKVPPELLRELDDLLSDDEGLSEAILGCAGYQEGETERLEKLIGESRDAAEETMGKAPPNPVDITTPRLLLRDLIDESKFPDHELMRLAQRELYISVMLGAREVSRRREYLALTFPKELGELYKAMSAALETASTTVLDLSKIQEYAKQIIAASEKATVINPRGNGHANGHANGNGGMPIVAEGDDLAKAFDAFDKAGRGNGH